MNPHSNTQLLSIISHARAGALDRAWEMFRQAGFDEETEDARVLSVKGRLLKDKARRAPAGSRRQAYREAASAYRAAARIDNSTYPLINAATLALLAGELENSQDEARDVLARIEANPDEPETPFYKLATKAEALLLLGAEDDALNLLSEAIGVAPQAWEDHASTLRQFALIMSAKGSDIARLDTYRPPRTMHFAGHMAVGDTATQDAVREQVREWMWQERIGFGFGALAAGADIVIAEALAEIGAELHVVLPSGIESFAARSVDPFGKDWRARYDRLLEQALSIKTLPPYDLTPDHEAIAAADRVAMGMAIMDADRLATSCAQLLILPEQDSENREKGMTSRSGRMWTLRGLPRKALTVSRDASAQSSMNAETVLDRVTIACIALAPANAATSMPEWSRQLESCLEHLRETRQPVPPAWHGEHVVIAFANVSEAVRFGLECAEKNMRVAADFLTCVPFRDPVHGGLRVSESDLAPLTGTGRTVLEASFNATENFVAAVTIESDSLAKAERVFEIEDRSSRDVIPIYSLRRPLID